MVRWDLDAVEFNLNLRNEHTGIYKKTVEKWGVEAQIKMAIEECAELVVALCHAEREIKYITRESIVKEIADVSLMLEQLCFILEVSPAEWFAEREEKLKRLSKLLNAQSPDNKPEKE